MKTSILRHHTPIMIMVIAVVMSKQLFAQSEFTLLDTSSTPSLTAKGYVELDNTVSTRPDQHLSDIFKKEELKVHATINYEKDSFSFYLDSNFYVSHSFINVDIIPTHIYNESFEIRRNGAITSEYAEINFREAYINYETGSLRVRAGNQIFAWGTADAFNPTSYFNPYDLREFLFKDDTERTMGVPAVSLLYTIRNDAFELALTPLHVPSLLPVSDTFWHMQARTGPFPVTIAQQEALTPHVQNMGIGAKYYRTLAGIDAHISAYRGPDKQPILRPMRTVLTPNKPVAIEAVPQYAVVTMIGMALSASYGDFVFQSEAVYSPNKTGVVEKDLVNLDTVQLQTLLPYATRQSGFVSYSAGFNYFIPVNRLFKEHRGQCVFTFEWSQSQFFDAELMKPVLSDIIVSRLQDSFFNDTLDVEISAIIEKQSKSWIAIPRIRYVFQSGLSVEVSYIHIMMTRDSYFYSYTNNDCVMWRISYEL